MTIKISFEVFKDMLLQRAGELEMQEDLYIPESAMHVALDYIYNAGEVQMSIDDILRFLADEENQNLDTLREKIDELGL